MESNTYLFPKELDSQIKISRHFYLKEFFLGVGGMAVVMLFQNLVPEQIMIPYYAFSALSIGYLILPSSNNPKKDNYESIYYTVIRKRSAYHPISFAETSMAVKNKEIKVQVETVEAIKESQSKEVKKQPEKVANKLIDNLKPTKKMEIAKSIEKENVKQSEIKTDKENLKESKVVNKQVSNLKDKDVAEDVKIPEKEVMLTSKPKQNNKIDPTDEEHLSAEGINENIESIRKLRAQLKKEHDAKVAANKPPELSDIKNGCVVITKKKLLYYVKVVIDEQHIEGYRIKDVSDLGLLVGKTNGLMLKEKYTSSINPGSILKFDKKNILKLNDIKKVDGFLPEKLKNEINETIDFVSSLN